MHFQSRHGVLLVAAVAALSFSLALPTGWTESSPLPWDEAGHLLGATEVHNALARADGAAFLRAVFGADQYPPGHSIALGFWMALFGTGVASWLSFGLVVYVLTAAFLARLHLAAGLLFAAFGIFGGLAPSLMVEPLAVLWVVLALGVMPLAIESREDRTRFVLTWVFAGFALMTKYNFGLPLVASLALGFAVNRRRRMVVGAAIGAGTVIAGWALFLTLQRSGWEMFRNFAVNRANSEGFSPLDRLGWYFDSFRDLWTGSTVLAVAMLVPLGLALWGGRQRWSVPRFVAAAALLASTLATLSVHEYLLGRNLVIAGAGFLVLVGVGLSTIGRRRRDLALHALAILVALVAIPFGGGPRERLVNAYFPSSARALDPLSDAVVSQLERGGQVRVVGTFNEFGAGWVRLLQMRHAPETAVRVDAPYPLERGRDRLDPRPDPAYAEIVEGWSRDGTRAVVSLEIAGTSPYRSDDYRRWGEWKHNLGAALEASSDFALTESESLEIGVTVLTFRPASAQ